MARKSARKRKPAKTAPKRSFVGRAIAFAAKWTATATVWAVIAALLAGAWYGTDLPDVDAALKATRTPSVTLFSVDGEVIARRGDLYGLPVQVGDLPPHLPEAVLATEDRRFYGHFGLDIIGLGRATWANLKAGRIVQGGSTITQQAAKNLFLTPERSFRRKVQELMLALWLEHRFSKDQIFSIYLNRVYFGAGTYGVDAAARRYFGRSAKRVSLYEAAMLAGLLKAPSRYNPLSNPNLARERANQVLNNMVAAGHLEHAQVAAAAGRPRRAATASGGRSARHFADWVLDQVSSYVAPGDRDLTVTTTLHAGWQRSAERALARQLREGRQAGATEAALVALAPDGAVRAMVGGSDYAKSQFNRATQAMRQPGSAFKPIVYLAGLESGMTPETEILDGPLRIGQWQPKNFDKRYRGPVSLAAGLAGSVNTVAVRIAELSGRGRVVETARRLGITAALRPTPSLALGASELTLLELTAAYGPFANGGLGVWAYGISEIKDGSGRLLYRRRGSGLGRAARPGHVADMNRMLAGVLAEGTGRAARLDRPAAGKTGTSQNFRDAWFVGYTADVVAGVWIGNDDGRPMNKVTGGGLPARLWRRFMVAAHEGLPVRALPGLGAPPPESDDEQGFWQNLLATLSGDAG